MNNDTVEQVRERIDITEVIGQHVQLRKAGKNFKGLCPFHQEKTPSFIVFPETQTFHCFGCGAGGDVFNFVMQGDRIDFREALQTLAEQAGVQLEPVAQPTPEVVEHHTHLIEITSRAANWFAHVLWQTEAGREGRALLEQRGVDRATAERFQLGFAPDRWDALLGFLTKRGIAVDDAVAAGLATKRDNGTVYDRFRNRLMFPIRDRDGRVVGFGGRALGDGQPKYLNTPQTPVFDKSAILYAFDLAQEHIRRTREVVVVEGYMDVIAAHQFGFENVVASMGTALTEAQVALVRRGVDRIILALDADAAGQMATLRGLDVLREGLAEPDRPALDAVGLVRFERTLKTDIRIAQMAAGKDPDELIRHDPDAWRAVIANPVPLIDFYIDAVIGPTPPTDPRTKSECVQRIAPMLRAISDRVVQGHYVGEVARRLRIPERSILTAPVRRNGSKPTRAAPSSQSRSPAVDPEEHLFVLMLQYPTILPALLPEIPDQDILDARRSSILRVLRTLSAETLLNPTEHLPDELRAYALALLDRAAERPTNYPGQSRREAEGVLVRLRKARHDFRMRQLLADITESERAQDREGIRHTMELIDQLKARYPEFYPGRSPYFRDARDTGS